MAKNSRFTDDGWAFWVDGEDTSTIYITEWINPAGTTYADLGIHIRGILESTALHIYIPFPITPEELDDISLKINSQSLLFAIFGVSGLIDYKKNACTTELAFNGKLMDLVHISATEFTIKPVATGSMLMVDFEPLKQYLDNDEAYFLFRIPHKTLSAVFHPEQTVTGVISRLQNLVTSPIISEHCGYAVRINEARRLPPEVTSMSAFHRQKLKKASIMISLPEDYETNDADCYRVRRLEKALYEGYVPAGYPSDSAVAYQWRASREGNLRGRFSFYFTMRHEYMKSASLIAYVIILVMTGAAGNALWELIKLIFSAI